MSILPQAQEQVKLWWQDHATRRFLCTVCDGGPSPTEDATTNGPELGAELGTSTGSNKEIESRLTLGSTIYQGAWKRRPYVGCPGEDQDDDSHRRQLPRLPPRIRWCLSYRTTRPTATRTDHPTFHRFHTRCVPAQSPPLPIKSRAKRGTPAASGRITPPRLHVRKP